MIRYVELVRVSTQGQADRDTPETQRQALERLRKSRPGKLVERIEAPGISGALPFDQRPDLARLKSLHGKYDELRVYALDRLTRVDDVAERFTVYNIVKRTGGIIVEASGRTINPADHIGQIELFFGGMWSAQEREKILTRTMDGKRRAVAAGRLPHGSPPYGRTFDKHTGTWGIDRERAKTYRKIFDLFLSGRSTREIVAHLNARGIPAPRVAGWGKSTVTRMLKDPSAAGEWNLWGQRIEIPAIVSPAILEEAKRRLASSGTRSGRPPRPDDVLLRRLLACGVCGRSMHVDITRDGRDRVYRCASRDRVCGKTHRTEHVDAIVRAHVRELLDRPEARRAGLLANPAKRLEEAAAEAQASLAELEQEEERLARLARRRLLSETVLARQAEEIAQLRASARSRLDAARKALASSNYRDELQARVEELRKRIRTTDAAGWREIVGIIFPRLPGMGLNIHPDGRIDGVGMLTLDSTGARELENTAKKLATTCSRTGQFPIVFRARKTKEGAV